MIDVNEGVGQSLTHVVLRNTCNESISFVVILDLSHVRSRFVTWHIVWHQQHEVTLKTVTHGCLFVECTEPLTRLPVQARLVSNLVVLCSCAVMYICVYHTPTIHEWPATPPHPTNCRGACLALHARSLSVFNRTVR